jgi:hypothetical protein
MLRFHNHQLAWYRLVASDASSPELVLARARLRPVFSGVLVLTLGVVMVSFGEMHLPISLADRIITIKLIGQCLQSQFKTGSENNVT